MSVVARQSIKYGIVGYFSVLIGVYSTLFIYPNDLEFAGKLQFIMPTALLIMPLVTMGIVLANVRFFTKLSQNNEHYNLLKFSCLFIARNFTIVTIVYFLASCLFPRIRKMDLWYMSLYVFLSLFFLSYTQLISRYLSIKKRIVVPNIFENVFPKLGMICAFYSYFFLGFSEQNAILLLVLFFAVAFLGMFLYLIKIDSIPSKTSFDFLKENNFKKELYTYSYFTFFGSLGTVVALNIDAYMIGEFLGYSDITIYNTSFNLVRMIAVPALGVYTISSPIIADFIENNKWEELNTMYQKTSLYLFTIGALFFTFIAVGIDDLFLLMKNGEVLSRGRDIIYIMGFALLFDLATGFNTYIIINSKYFKFNNILTVGLAFLTIVTNLFFIFVLKLGIIGVAMATSISMTVYNIVKVGFNYKKFGVQPFSKQYLYIIGFVISGIVLGYFLPHYENKWVNLFYKPIIVMTLFLIWNAFFKIFNMNDFFKQKIFGFFNNDKPSH
jgi:O-antigen/teichoic acid export membrane protein